MLEDNDQNDDDNSIVYEHQTAFFSVVPLEGAVRVAVCYEVTLALSDIDSLLEAVKETVEDQIREHPLEDGPSVYLDSILAGCLGNRMDLFEETADALKKIRTDALNKSVGISLE